MYKRHQVTLFLLYLGHQEAGVQRRAKREVGVEVLTRANPRDPNIRQQLIWTQSDDTPKTVHIVWCLQCDHACYHAMSVLLTSFI